MPLKLTIVTAQRTVLEQDGVTKLVVPAAEGQITILPGHAALMSSLAIGEMVATAPGGVEPIAIHGGFIQVANNEVSVLADAAERVDQIDLDRAEAARERAQARLQSRDSTLVGGFDVLRAQLALQRSLTRLRVARRRTGGATGVPSQRA
ncbi:MAG: ATP synthase F1 subunit epsilon [Dehalococcoidia bacterium]|nr:ATP synthase F1 subunit epsilon [Dehalococcoidia bacterium]